MRGLLRHVFKGTAICTKAGSPQVKGDLTPLLLLVPTPTSGVLTRGLCSHKLPKLLDLIDTRGKSGKSIEKGYNFYARKLKTRPEFRDTLVIKKIIITITIIIIITITITNNNNSYNCFHFPLK